MALQILNMSIDAPVAEKQAGDKSADNFNYIDSYVEYVAEIILKFDNAIPESNHRDHKEIQLHKHIQITFQKFQPPLQGFCINEPEVSYQNSSDSYAYQFIKEINPPPPKSS